MAATKAGKRQGSWRGWVVVSETEWNAPKSLPDAITYTFELMVEACSAGENTSPVLLNESGLENNGNGKTAQQGMDSAFQGFINTLRNSTSASSTPSPSTNILVYAGSGYRRVGRNVFRERSQNYDTHKAICYCKPVPETSAAYYRALIQGQRIGCGLRCLNRMMQMECHPDRCPTGLQCSNQRFQRQEWVQALDVFDTGDRGYGVRTLTPILKGTLVIEYVGDVVSFNTCWERMESSHYADNQNFYFLHYNRDEIIDGTKRGNVSRFVNHSCEPNCHIEKWYFDGEYHIGIVATQDIAIGIEITYDYAFDAFDKSGKSNMQICRCGSVHCRKTLGVSKGKPELIVENVQVLTDDLKITQLSSLTNTDDAQPVLKKKKLREKGKSY